MSDRRTENLEGIDDGKSKDVPQPPKVVEPEALAAVVDINYPEPTALSMIVKDVSRWSGHCFVMEPSLNAKLQIFAPRKLSRGDAYEIFLASLSVVNLRAVQIGKIVKIVQVSVVVAA